MPFDEVAIGRAGKLALATAPLYQTMLNFVVARSNVLVPFDSVEARPTAFWLGPGEVQHARRLLLYFSLIQYGQLAFT